MKTKSEKQKVGMPTYPICGDITFQAVFPKQLHFAFGIILDLAFEISRDLLDAHFPASIHEDILQAVGIEFPVQTSQRKKRDPRLPRKRP